MLVREGSFIDGKWEPSTSKASTVVINPFAEEPFGRATVATKADVDKSVRSAQAAFERGEWRNAPLEERISVTEGMRDRIAERTDELGGVSTLSPQFAEELSATIPFG
jgi:acyl-CoA reductase-like NAD-dependent aldehyde dehydrogenase